MPNSSDGLPPALRAAIADHHALVYRVAHHVLRNAADAEDTTQRVFLRLLEEPAALERARSLPAWLARVTVNSAKNTIRSERSRRQREETWARSRPAKENAMDPEDREEIARAVAELPTEMRLPIALHYVEGFKYREIAEILDQPEGTVGRRMTEARTELERKLGRRGVGVSGASLPGALAVLEVPAMPVGLESRVVDAVAAKAVAAGAATGAVATATASATTTTSSSWLLGTIAAVALTATAIVAATSLVGEGDPVHADPTEEVALRTPEKSPIDAAVTGAPPASEPTATIANPTDPGGDDESSDDAVATPAALPLLHGVVVDGEGRFVSGARVTLLAHSSGKEIGSTLTDSKGGYAFETVDAVERRRPSPRRSPVLDEGTRGARREAELSRRRALVESMVDEQAGRDDAANESLELALEELTNEPQIDIPPQREVDNHSQLRGVAQQMSVSMDSGLQIEVVAAGHELGLSRFFSYEYLAKDEHSERVDFTLDAATPLFGAVLDESGSGIAGARVRVVANFGDPREVTDRVRSVETDASGEFDFSSLPEGAYLLEASAEGFVPRRGTYRSGERSEPLRLARGGTLLLSIQGSLDEHANAKLRVLCDLVPLYTRDIDGPRVALQDLPPGEITIELFDPSSHEFVLSRASVTVSSGVSIAVLIAIPPTRTIRGSLTRRGDSPVSYLTVSRIGSDASPTSERVFQVVRDNEFTLPSLPPGRYALAISDIAKGPRHDLLGARIVDVTDGDAQVEIPFELEKLRTLSARVVDENGYPVPRAWVRIRNEDLAMNLGARRTDESGEITLDALPGQYTLNTTSPNHRRKVMTGLVVRPDGESRFRIDLVTQPDRGPSTEALTAWLPESARRLRAADSLTLPQLLELVDHVDGVRVRFAAEELSDEVRSKLIYAANLSELGSTLHSFLEQSEVRWKLEGNALYVWAEASGE